MEKTEKELMEIYLLEHTGVKAVSILNMTNKDYRSGTKIIADNTQGRKEVECRVSISEYKKWLETRKTVEWL